jgi:hypothetical protein
LAQAAGLPLGDSICQKALAQAQRHLPAQIAVEVWATDPQGNLVGYAGDTNWARIRA